MARKRKSSPRRRSRATSLLNLAESYAYADVLTSGVMGTTPLGFVTGKADIGMQRVGSYNQLTGNTSSMQLVGTDVISLADITTSPGESFNAMQSNFQSNYMNMFYRAAAINVSFKLGKRLLRGPISSVNKSIFKPLGAGFKL